MFLHTQTLRYIKSPAKAPSKILTPPKILFNLFVALVHLFIISSIKIIPNKALNRHRYFNPSFLANTSNLLFFY